MLNRSLSKIYILLIGVISIQSNSFAQESDSTGIKTGWNFGALPALGYDSNLGLLYGGLVNFYDYGDGKHYPDYNHSILMQLSAYTHGSMDAILNIDSYSLIPNKHFIGWLSYNRNRLYPFYGFNGKQTRYNVNFIDQDQQDFITQVFYNIDFELIKADAILQDKFGDSDFNWLLSLDLGYYKINAVDISHLNNKKNDSNQIKDTTTLYDKYINWGLINEKERKGGFDNSVKLGLVYDTRDRITNPMKGVWTELITRLSPKFWGGYNSFFKVSLIHRQYFTLIEEKLSFAYRVWYEGAFGNIPFYSRQYLTSSDYIEGMGGAYTIRGILMNRIIAKQINITNLELRWRAYNFETIGQNFYLGFNAFADGGYILKGYDLDKTTVSITDQEKYFEKDYKDLITSGGLGLKLVMNENFVVSAEYAKSFDKNYGDSGLYIKVDYLF